MKVLLNVRPNIQVEGQVYKTEFGVTVKVKRPFEEGYNPDYEASGETVTQACCAMLELLILDKEI